MWALEKTILNKHMKTLYNFLNPTILSYVQEEVDFLTGKDRWFISNHTWSSDLRVGVTGIIAIANASDQLVEVLAEAISPHVPEFRQLTAQHHLWYPNSGIVYHNDAGKENVFGATIYLTKEWDIDWGGLFVYGNEYQEDYRNLKATFPTYNSININDNFDWHAVTAVSPLAPYPRYTIQLRGYNNET
jgi:hypothetical protein